MTSLWRSELGRLVMPGRIFLTRCNKPYFLFRFSRRTKTMRMKKSWRKWLVLPWPAPSSLLVWIRGVTPTKPSTSRQQWQPPTRYNNLQHTLSIPPTRYNNLQHTLSIPPTRYNNLQHTLSIPPTRYNNLQHTLSIPPTRYNNLQHTLSIPPTRYNNLQHTLSTPPPGTITYNTPLVFHHQVQ